LNNTHTVYSLLKLYYCEDPEENSKQKYTKLSSFFFSVFSLHFHLFSILRVDEGEIESCSAVKLKLFYTLRVREVEGFFVVDFALETNDAERQNLIEVL
jgi:hypothetical protein